MADQSSFTGRRRDRKTKMSIKITDVVARLLITFGGIGTIVAVMTVALFLIWIVWPLIEPARVTGVTPHGDTFKQVAPIQLAADEYQTIAYAFMPDGKINLINLANGSNIETRNVTDKKITAHRFSVDGSKFVLGFDTGEIQTGSLSFQTLFFERDNVPVALENLEEGDSQSIVDYRLTRTDDDARRLMTAADARSANLPNLEPVTGIVQVTPKGQYRLQRLIIDVDEPKEIAGEWPIHLVERVGSGSDPTFVIFNDADKLIIAKPTSRMNLLTGETVTSIEQDEIPYQPRPDTGKPAYMLVSGLADTVFLAWEDGTVQRYHTRNPATASLVETFDVTEGPDTKLTVFQYMLGSSTVVMGDSRGDLSAWFGFRPREPVAVGRTKDGYSIVRSSFLPDAAVKKLRKPKDGEIPSHLESYAGTLLINEYPEDLVFAKAHQLPRGDSAVTTVSSSSRSRMIAAGYASGKIRIQQITTDTTLLTTNTAEGTIQGEPVEAVAITPKENGILAAIGDQLVWWKTDKQYPEATPASLFTPIWYEGQSMPSHIWQSSSGSDDFEMKLGIVPLIFGTLKATFFAMIFAVPLALLAAIYTSEFLHPKAKTRIKPIVEMMASLPSVVLGFLGGLVFAPIIGQAIPAVLAAFMMIPLAFLVAAYAWQLLPRASQLYLTNMGVAEAKGGGAEPGVKRVLYQAVFFFGGVRLLLLLVMLAVGVIVAIGVGPIFDSVLFAGDLRAWLNYSPYDGSEANQQYSNGLGGWVALLWPVGAVITALIFSRFVNPRLREMGQTMSRPNLALLDIVKFLVGIVLTIVIAILLGVVLLTIGFDPRGPAYLGGINFAPMGSYIQRNALIIGIAMGFAVIPLIYTLAEDALSSVPEHLRSASLGCGATPWQTATTIIVPTATSGLFSACMIGLGRAVGETMIVLMAFGSTAIMDLNIFNGARPLSANIAIEMPEAVKGSTHYRTLFLCGLTLFVMTFVVNTLAEGVRQRFRKRNKNL